MDDRVFEALADATRRRIIELLSEGELTAGEIAEHFPVSRPAVSRHLRVLRESGLVTYTEDAQRRVYAVQTAPLAAVGEWLDRHRLFWANRFDALHTELARGARRPNPGDPGRSFTPEREQTTKIAGRSGG